jgi:hypothetical protein
MVEMAYSLKECIGKKLAEQAQRGMPQGLFECKLLGVCPSKNFRGFRTYCWQSPFYDNISKGDEKEK